ncbi:antibiotic biosynthesis monooxygenase family protein [Ochrovirga pacifica]|uniref:antibiotic biosynthesis monooxygenase family protein n=1 Tax=Ochrovirga pacifica TaxID=1042376 RepID=UPI0002558B2A|nr:antibiotic biosynthesis monooxygenase [Ochrovirga pacifica]
MKIANTPQVPYYAVIFTSIKRNNTPQYNAMAETLINIAQEQKGFLGIESARNEIGITVSYWKSLEAIQAWKQHSQHIIAQEKGKSEWYKHYKTRICKVERDYEFFSL